MSPTDNVIHLVLVTCYHISHDKVAVSFSNILSPPLRHSRNMLSQSYQVPLCTCRTQQRKASFSPGTIVQNVDWNRLPQTAVLSDSGQVIKGCHYHILSLNSLTVLYIFFNLFLIFTFFFFFAMQFPLHNLQTVEVHYVNNW